MKRRKFLEQVGVGSAAFATLPGIASGQDHAHGQLSGPLANATVSFGQWPADPDNPLSRFPNLSPQARNVHQLLPNEVTIKAGGAVNFIIAGFHHVLVYDDGTQPGDIVVDPAVLLIDYAPGRIYRGLDPSTLTLLTIVQPATAAPFAPVIIPAIPAAPPNAASPAFFALAVRDRVEVVQFPKPGTYLVICGVRPHFVNDKMFGFVKVNP